jgi:hypothetical protein
MPEYSDDSSSHHASVRESAHGACRNGKRYSSLGAPDNSENGRAVTAQATMHTMHTTSVPHRAETHPANITGHLVPRLHRPLRRCSAAVPPPRVLRPVAALAAVPRRRALLIKQRRVGAARGRGIAAAPAARRISQGAREQQLAEPRRPGGSIGNLCPPRLQPQVQITP